MSCEVTGEVCNCEGPVRSGAHSSRGFLVKSLTGMGLAHVFLFNCFVLGMEQLWAPVCFSAQIGTPFSSCVSSAVSMLRLP